MWERAWKSEEKEGYLMSLWLTALDGPLSVNLVIWVFPLAFLVHDLEEIVTMERFRRENRERFPKFLRNIATITTRQFTLAVGALLALTLLASYLATRSPRQMDLFTIGLAIFFGHIGQSLFLRTYTPGVVTALLVVLPYSLYGFHRLSTASLLDGTSFTTLVLIGALLFVPLILATSQLGKLLTRR
jgi:hypothetical protein